MKAKDLIKVLQENPEADILVEGATQFPPVEAGVYPWGDHLFVIVQEEYLAQAMQDAEVIQDLDPDPAPLEDWVKKMKAQDYVFPAEREDC